MKHEQRFVWLDLARGLCAIVVDHSSLASSSWMQKLFYLATGFGHQAVMVFFVLSGLFVGGAVLRNRAHFNWQKYSIARLSRLWVVLIPALLVTALVDQWLNAYSPEVLSGAYRSVWNSGPSPDEAYSASFSTGLLNLFCLQTIVAPVFGTNGPLWSLANEFWYYVLLPLCVLAIGGRANGNTLSVVHRAAIALLGITVFVWLPAGIQQGFFIWLLGLVVYRFAGTLKPSAASVTTVAGAVLFAAALMYSKASALQASVAVTADVVVGASFCVLCIGLANLGSETPAARLLAKAARASSEFSYSLYLLHFPLVLLIATLFYRTDKLMPDASGLLQFTLWLAVLLAFGAVFWWLFERRTDAIRRWVTRHTARPPLAPTPSP
jgi:peptidoglycan/LPS O-acetylase OafA/YrhL